MKTNNVFTFLAKCLTGISRIWHNPERSLRGNGLGRTTSALKRNRVRAQLLRDLKRRPDHRMIISLPGVPD
jgi:hypothetical protein